jgi:ribonuclease Z
MIRSAGAAAAAAFLTGLAGPAAAFDGIRLTLLATGADSGPSALVEAGQEVLVFDCGAGTRERLRQAGMPLRDVTALFLTSLDPVHVAGCAELVRSRTQLDLDEPLLLWGPQGTVEMVEQWGASRPGRKPAAVLAHEIGENVVFQTDELTVTAIIVDYPPQPQAFGYRVDRARRAIALVGGTRYSENVAHAVRGVQVLVHEVVAADPDHAANDPAARTATASHTSPEDAGRIFHAAQPYLAVYSHVQLFGVSVEEVFRRTRRHYRGALEAGRDRMIVEVQNEVQVRAAPSDGPRGDRAQ